MPEIDYIKFDNVELRPGAWVITGRKASPVPKDYEALIVNAWKTKGSPKQFKDWEYEIEIPPDYGPYIISLAGIYAPIRGAEEPEVIIQPPPQEIIVVSSSIIRSVNNELLEYLSKNPCALDYISAKELEDITAAIYRNNGFDVELMGRWNQPDGGVDILAVQRSTSAGMLRLAIQCKRSRNKISAEPIRSLRGVLDRFEAHRGVLVTSSYFTENALKEARNYYFNIDLMDRIALVDALRSRFK